MKKTLSILLASALMSAGMTAALAADEEKVTVIVDGREIVFDDQAAVIVDDRTLVPARGVFQSADCTVNWYEEENKVVVNSADNRTRIVMYLGSNNMEVYTFTTVIDTTRQDITLDVAPMLLNDRTMIPLRAVSDAIDAEVIWNEEEYTAYINTMEITKSTYSPDENTELSLPKIYAVSDKTSVAAGDEITISLYASGISDLADEYYMSAFTTALIYDKEKFKIVEQVNYPADTSVIFTGASNESFTEKSSKLLFLSGGFDFAAGDAVELMQVKLLALTEGSSEIQLSSAYNTRIGNDTELIFMNKETKKTLSLSRVDEIIIDTNPITVSVNAADGADDKNTEDSSAADASDNSGSADTNSAADADSNTDINGSEIVEDAEEDTDVEDTDVEDADSEDTAGEGSVEE